MSNLVEETRNIMKKYGIRANKDLGQNFLINNEVVENIVNSSEISQDDMVIEIGPGLGTLTKYLLEKAGKVLCIELDRKMIEILEDRFEEYSNFEIINDDVLKVDLNKIIKENKENEKIMKDNRRYLLQIARGEQPKQSFIRIYTVINGEKKLQSENEIEFDEDINIEIVTSKAELLELQK